MNADELRKKFERTNSNIPEYQRLWGNILADLFDSDELASLCMMISIMERVTKQSEAKLPSHMMKGILSIKSKLINNVGLPIEMFKGP